MTVRGLHQQLGMAQSHVSFYEQQGFKTVGFEKSMWCRHDANGDKIMVGSQIDDFCICGTNRACLDEFRLALLDPAKGGFEGNLHHYLGCAIARDPGFLAKI